MTSEQANSMTSGRETARLQARANLLLALYSHACQDLERVRLETDRLCREVRQQADRQLAEMRAEVDRVHRDTGSELHRLAERAAQLQERLDAVLNSTSWRMTAPLRVLSRLIGRR